MERLTITTASAFDMLESLSPGAGRVTRQRFGEMARQVSEGVALTLRDESGRLACVMGLWPEADHAEAWLAIGPAFRPNLLAALRQVRAALEATARGEAVRVYVHTPAGADRVAGLRMAAWLGFRRIGDEATRLGPVAVFSRDFGGADVHGGHG